MLRIEGVRLSRAVRRAAGPIIGPMSKHAKPPRSEGVVEWFSDEEGWGAISAPEVPGGCFVHFSNIETSGYRALRAGQHVRFTFEEPGILQDGYRYRALGVWPSD